MSLSKKLRFEVLKRDKFTCQYCGKAAPDVVLQVDHIDPVANGGSDDMMNLIASCFDCNQGKKHRLLSDDSAVQKRKAQLDDLQERREQIEMMLEWQKGLSAINDDAVQAVDELWQGLTGTYNITDAGKKKVKAWIAKWSLMDVMNAMRTSFNQYAAQSVSSDDSNQLDLNSVVKAFEYIPRILTAEKAIEGKPHMKDLYYIRGIVKNRFSYFSAYKAIAALETAYDAGVSIDDMKTLAKTAKNWTAFIDGLTMLTEGVDNE